MNASLNDKLQAVKWGEYEIESLFEKLNLGFKKKVFDKENDVSTEKTDEFCLPLVNAKDGNNGIMYFGRTEDFDSAELTIDIVNDGAVSTGSVYSQPQRTGVLYNAYLIKPLCKVSPNILHFFACVIQKSIKHKFGYENKAGWAKVKQEKIQLPIKDGEIDFDFIEEFISELETQRLASLSAYLKANGYNNYELSAEELDALHRFSSLEDRNWGTYKVGTLFERVETKKLPYKAKELPKQPTDDYVLPCLTSSFQNQGLNYYAPKAGATVLSNVISIPSNSDVYRAYYQSREFTVLSDSYAIRWKSDKIKISPNHYLFMVMCINKVTDLPIYSYKNKLGGWNVVKGKYIRLPEKDGKIDFAFMETFISAIKKLAIKDVVLYSDQKIKATKSVVSSHFNQ